MILVAVNLHWGHCGSSRTFCSFKWWSVNDFVRAFNFSWILKIHWNHLHQDVEHGLVQIFRECINSLYFQFSYFNLFNERKSNYIEGNDLVW